MSDVIVIIIIIDIIIVIIIIIIIIVIIRDDTQGADDNWSNPVVFNVFTIGELRGIPRLNSISLIDTSFYANGAKGGPSTHNDVHTMYT